ncbi:uncharacterized protein UDID_18187 [Ustilago sp. UG-2017a]|nr:uncharacterized protein UDID_18187 [Ustilago sp. UG-2017a]
MTTSTDDSLDISAQLFWQSTTPTSSATQTKSMPALSQSGSTSKKNCTWSGANVLHLVTILYNSESYHHALLPSRESAESNPALKLCKHPIFREISVMGLNAQEAGGSLVHMEGA